MTKDMFVKWLLTEPKFLVWLSTLHRIHAAISGTKYRQTLMVGKS